MFPVRYSLSLRFLLLKWRQILNQNLFFASLMEFSHCWTSKQEATLASSASKEDPEMQESKTCSLGDPDSSTWSQTNQDISRPQLELEWTHHHHVEWTSWPSGSHPIITFLWTSWRSRQTTSSSPEYITIPYFINVKPCQ